MILRIKLAILHLFIVFLCFSQQLYSQIVSVTPPGATTDSNITLTYNAALGNGDLAGFSGDVYLYTGVITAESTSGHDWKYVQSNWGTANPKTLMTRVSTNTYTIEFNIRDFYGIPAGEEVLKLALLFHNEDYSKVGRNADGSDIFADINLVSPGNYISHQQTGSQLNVLSETGNFLITFYEKNLVKSEFVPGGSTVSDTSFTVVGSPASFTPLLSESVDTLKFIHGDLEVIIPKQPVRLIYVYRNDTLLRENPGYYSQQTGGGIRFSTNPGTYYYGGGSHAIPYERSGKNLRIYNEARYGYGPNTSPLNIAIPFVMTSDGYGLFMDSRYPSTLEFPAAGSNQLKMKSEGDRLRYYFMAGDSYDEILDRYTSLTGKQPLPPLWSLGYIQSKYGYESQTEATAKVNNLRADGFPLDALILDLYWFGQTNDMGNLDWNIAKWPNPTQMMSDFEDQGVKTILITEPYFTLNSTNYQYLADNNLLATNNAGDPFVLWGFWAGDATLLDLTKQEARDWMWSFYADRREEGVGGWWLDLGEPETHPWEMQHEFGPAKSVHNIYSLVWARMLFEKYRENYPQERLFNLIRSGYAGMQRYSTFPWSGDIQRTFEGLRVQIPIMLSMGMNGIGYMHSDVGGFVGSDNDSELFTRWVQFGVFAPILRLHGVGTTSPLDFPVSYRNIVRKYIRLRYQMLPYNYTLAWKNTVHGTPLALPMNYFDPSNSFLASMDDQYFWGENLIIAPIMDRNQTQRNVTFPEGKWIDYENNTVYNGNSVYSVSAPIEKIPVFAKAGSFIPQTNLVNSTKYYTSDTLHTIFFQDQSVVHSHFTLFIDNGKDPESLQKGEYELIHFAGQVNEDEIRISLNKEGLSYPGAPANRNMIFELRRIFGEPKNVFIDEASIPKSSSMSDLRQNPPSWYFNNSLNSLFVHTSWDGNDMDIKISPSPTRVEEMEAPPVTGAYIHAAWPNPFDNETQLKMDFDQKGEYILDMYDITGRKVDQDRIQVYTEGRHSYTWSPGNSIPSGIYLIRISGQGSDHSVKVIKQ
jgi:oligosaccharide 4-alpha-D-glucosyltransferase